VPDGRQFALAEDDVSPEITGRHIRRRPAMTTSIQTQHQPLVLNGQAGRLAAGLMAFVLLAGAAIGLANGAWSASAGAVADTSYDVVEAGRAQITLGAAPDTSYETGEKVRLGAPSGGASDTPSRGRGLIPS
jgi:hypothetical protein